MKCLSVRQPWAWLIIHGPKDVENRTWSTAYRGILAIHASRGCTRRQYEDAADFAAELGVTVPPLEYLPRGAILGTARLLRCTDSAPSRWAAPGQWHWVLAHPDPLPRAVPFSGTLGLFTIDWDRVARESVIASSPREIQATHQH